MHLGHGYCVMNIALEHPVWDVCTCQEWNLCGKDVLNC